MFSRQTPSGEIKNLADQGLGTFVSSCICIVFPPSVEIRNLGVRASAVRWFFGLMISCVILFSLFTNLGSLGTRLPLAPGGADVLSARSSNSHGQHFTSLSVFRIVISNAARCEMEGAGTRPRKTPASGPPMMKAVHSENACCLRTCSGVFFNWYNSARVPQ